MSRNAITRDDLRRTLDWMDIGEQMRERFLDRLLDAQERAARDAARECADIAVKEGNPGARDDEYQRGYTDACERIASAIRARFQVKP